MSKTRHPDEPVVRGYAVTHPAGGATFPEANGWDRLIYTASGTLTVHARDRVWMVPPHRALWIPEGLDLTICNRYPVAVRTLYFAASLRAAPTEMTTVVVSGFSCHLLLHVVRVCPLDRAVSGQQALLTVLLEQLRGLPRTSLQLPLPREAITRRAAEMMREHANTSTPAVARAVGTSHRTLERRFMADVGMTLGSWRRRARILDALEPLAAGASVSQASYQAGYSTPSAFVTAFTRELGQSPLTFTRKA